MIMNLKLSIQQYLKYMTLHLFQPLDIHVKMSKAGKVVINDNKLASKVVDTILNNKENLQNGEVVKVDGESISIEIVTSMDENIASVNKK